MSEPSSLYAKIRISPLARQAFLNSTISNADTYRDWIPWLETKEFYGSLTQADINAMTYQDQTTQAYLQQWITSRYAFGHEMYDEHTATWIISMYEFSENYREYIHFLHVLRSVDRFKDLQDDDFILVHSYNWGNTESDVAIQIKAGESKVLTTIPNAYLTEASEHLALRQKTLSEMYQD